MQIVRFRGSFGMAVDAFFLVILFNCYDLSGVSGEIYLEKLDSLYLPYSYNPVPLYEFNKAAAEQSAYDAEKHLVYSVGESHIHVTDASDPGNLRVLAFYEVGDGAEMTDVEVCGEFIFTGVDNKTVRENGRLIIFQYNAANKKLVMLHSIIVGPLPDMILPTKDCNTVFVGLEAEAYVDAAEEIIDPEGGVGILRWNSSDISGPPTYRILDFTKFNPRTEELVNSGVRFTYRKNNNTLSRDLEPEYITLNEDETMAYVCLQENSAIAVVNITDLDEADIIDIYPLGFKSWINYTMDASDKDDGPNMESWPVYAMFQPDAIHYLTHNGEGYIVTANEGDSKEYFNSTGGLLFTEERRGKDMLTENLLSSGVDSITRGYLDKKSQLGRLKFQYPFGLENGTDRPYSYGARGFSLVRTSDMKVVYDSGDSVEKSILEKYPALFNCDSKPDMTPWEGTDGRSDAKGPECESLTYGKLWGKTVIFMGNERPGTISIYSIADGTLEPRFESVNFFGVMKEGRTWKEMYERRTSGDMDPEDVRFISAEQSGIGKPLLLVSGSVSGTVSMYAVQMRDITTPMPTTTLAPGGNTDGQTVVCSSSQLKCRNTNRCVAVTYKCDGVDDCGDSTDEAGCTSESAAAASVHGLVIAIVCLTSVSVLLLLGLCCLLHRKKASQKEYEMKTKL